MNNIITLTSRFSLVSDEGKLKYFKPQEQYEYIIINFRTAVDTIPDKEYRGKFIQHYTCIIEDNTYYIPCIYGSIYDKPYPEFVTDKIKYEEWNASNDSKELNVNKVYKEALGRNIDNTYKPEKSRWYKNLLKQNDNGKHKQGY